MNPTSKTRKNLQVFCTRERNILVGIFNLFKSVWADYENPNSIYSLAPSEFLGFIVRRVNCRKNFYTTDYVALILSK